MEISALWIYLIGTLEQNIYKYKNQEKENDL